MRSIRRGARGESRSAGIFRCVAFYHSNMPQLIARRIGEPTERVLSRYVRWLYERCDAVLAPSRYMCNYLNSIGVQHTVYQPLGVDANVFHPSRRTLDLRSRLGLRAEHTAARVRGKIFGREESRACCSTRSRSSALRITCC